MVAANYGDADERGFVVILFNTVAPREYQTVRNGDFSFVVMKLKQIGTNKAQGRSWAGHGRRPPGRGAHGKVSVKR